MDLDYRARTKLSTGQLLPPTSRMTKHELVGGLIVDYILDLQRLNCDDVAHEQTAIYSGPR